MSTSLPSDDESVEIDEILRDASDDLGRPEMIPVNEAGGGVAEGFEQAEAELIENATEGPPDGTLDLDADAPGPEAEEDRAVYGEADHEHQADEEAAP